MIWRARSTTETQIGSTLRPGDVVGSRLTVCVRSSSRSAWMSGQAIQEHDRDTVFVPVSTRTVMCIV